MTKLEARALAIAIVVVGCGDEPSDGTRICTLKGCGGGIEDLRFIDDTGAPALARSEFRTSDARGEAVQITLDCSPPSGAHIPGCSAGAFEFMALDFSPQTLVDVRFGRPDGSWTDWQPLPLTQTEHTDPDFNGPGCPCTWRTATTPPLVVPPDARWGDAAP
ncbi:MAG TPA: hypothetical protein VMG12_20500 [Polyangiaceae bacterium]|nr:hypothetical protein [Polyangiaceae bacterium]